jgi:hypothetical protein
MNRLAIGFALALLSAATSDCESRGESPAANPSASPTASSAAIPAADLVADAGTCEPQVVVLPRLDERPGWLSAMNDSGWAVGSSFNQDEAFGTAVMWRDGVVIDLGLGGGLVPGGRVDSRAVDVNEDGVVAAQRLRYKGNRLIAHTSFLWQDGDRERLRGSKKLPRAIVEAVNDGGVAVGYISDLRGRDFQPVVWRNGARDRLPIPAGTTGDAVAINNRGLVVGTVRPRGPFVDTEKDTRFWYWRLGGKSGPLSSPPGYPMGMIDVDNHNRILGQTFDNKSAFVLWKGPTSPGRLLGGAVPPGEDGTTLDHPQTTDMNDHGDLTGYRGGLRGLGDRPWVSRLGADRPTRLPKPPGGYASSTHATSVIRGVTWFAPKGGRSVGGHAIGYSGDDGDAVIWTCTQTY